MALDSTKITLTLAGDYTSVLDLATATLPLREAFYDELTSGTSADMADLLYCDRRTLSATTSETLDLSGGLTDSYGNTLLFRRIKLIYIKNRSSTAGYRLLVGGNSSTPWTGWTSVAGSKAYVGPGGFLCLYDPSLAAMATTGATTSTDDLLKVENPNGGSVDYDIVIMGASV